MKFPLLCGVNTSLALSRRAWSSNASISSKSSMSATIMSLFHIHPLSSPRTILWEFCVSPRAILLILRECSGFIPQRFRPHGSWGAGQRTGGQWERKHRRERVRKKSKQEQATNAQTCDDMCMSDFSVRHTLWHLEPQCDVCIRSNMSRKNSRVRCICLQIHNREIHLARLSAPNWCSLDWSFAEIGWYSTIAPNGITGFRTAFHMVIHHHQIKDPEYFADCNNTQTGLQ